jgi:hypothetical protein
VSCNGPPSVPLELFYPKEIHRVIGAELGPDRVGRARNVQHLRVAPRCSEGVLVPVGARLRKKLEVGEEVAGEGFHQTGLVGKDGANLLVELVALGRCDGHCRDLHQSDEPPHALAFVLGDVERAGLKTLERACDERAGIVVLVQRELRPHPVAPGKLSFERVRHGAPQLLEQERLQRLLEERRHDEKPTLSLLAELVGATGSTRLARQRPGRR